MTPSIPAISMAAKARYGLAAGSGGRNSTRLALGLAEYMGMRQAAERLRREYARFTRGSGPGPRRLVPRHQALVTVGGGGDDRRKRPRVFQQPADVMERHLAQPRIAVAPEQRLAVFPQTLMAVHAAAVILEQRLGHEGHGLAILVRHVADYVLIEHHIVRRLHQLVEPLIDLALAAGGHFVVMTLDVQAALDHGLHHFAAQILVVVGRRHREVAFLVARAVAQVVLAAARVPTPFLGVDKVKTAVLILVETDVIENEELGFRAEIG